MARRKKVDPADRGHKNYYGDFVTWLRERCEEQAALGAPIASLRPFRVSSESVTLWLASAVASFEVADKKDPDVAAALELGFDVVRRDVIGETKRAELANTVFLIRMHHAPGGVGKKQLGVALHVGRTIFIYMMSSARADNLAGRRNEVAGNAFTEILSVGSQVMFEVGRDVDPHYRPTVYAREHDRIVRSEYHGARLKQTLVDCEALVYAPNLYDLTDETQASGFTFGTLMSASAANSSMTRMNRVEIVIQAQGGYYESLDQVPFTHGPLTLIEEDYRTKKKVTSVDKHRLAPVDDVEGARALLRELVDAVLVDRTGGTRALPETDWLAVGNLMAASGLPSRKPSDLKRNILVADLPEASRAGIAKNFFSERWVSAWRTGTFTKDVPVKIGTMSKLDLADYGVTPVLDKRNKVIAYRCTIKVPLPDGGWGVSDEEWAEVLRRTKPMKDMPRNVSGMVLPLSGGLPWYADTSQYAIKTRNNNYVLVSRAAACATHPDGTHRSWQDAKGERVAGARATDFHASLGSAVIRALLALEQEVEPLVLSVPSPRRTSTLDETDPDRLRTLEDRLGKAKTQVDGARDSLNEARGAHKVEQSEESAEEVVACEEALERAKTKLNELKDERRSLEKRAVATTVTRVSEEAGRVDTATAEFVAVALESCLGLAPGWLREACSQLLHDLKIAVIHNIGMRPTINWSCTLRLTATDAPDGRQRRIEIPLSGSFRAKKNAANGKPTTNGPENWAWNYFYKGRTFQQIGEDAGIDGSRKKNSFLYKGLSTWLIDTNPVVPDIQMRAAALDLPIHEARRVLWSEVTRDDASCRGMQEGYVRHLRTTYAQESPVPRWGWCRDTHDLARAAADVMLAHGGSAPIYWLAEQLNVSAADLLPLARVNGKRTKDRPVTYKAKLAVSPFTKNWSRGAGAKDPSDRILFLRACPHRDCPERVNGGQPFASHVLAVPETEDGHGVLCPSCRRLPELRLAHVQFPQAYLRPWRGLLGRAAGRGPRAHHGTHLDPMRHDPGPGTPLVDTGAMPRPETRIHHAGNHSVRHLRSTPLGGARVMVLGITGDRLDVLHRRIEALGGRIARNVTASIALVVVPAGTWAGDARLERVQELGLRLITEAELTMRGEEAA